MNPAVQRFACTQCGKCCNRSPEVELSEAAALADVFVFRLLFRLYWLPNKPNDCRVGHSDSKLNAQFYERKRLLGAFAARKYPVKVRRDGKSVEYTKYLVISGLALDTSLGACSALDGTRCGIYDRRPFSCRSVPLHYSRPESSLDTDLNAFVETAGYRCDTSDAAPVTLSEGRIVAPEIRAARSDALALAASDRRWSEAIVRRMSRASPFGQSLPSLEEIHAVAPHAAVTTSMRAAWQVAAEIGLINDEECDRLVELQLHAIDRALTQRTCSEDARETLIEMNAEYRQHLSRAPRIAANGYWQLSTHCIGLR